MLVATPFIKFDVRKNNGPPRVISEIRKRYPTSPLPTIRPKISGDLLVICGNDRRWWPRKVTVRAGQLHIAQSENGPSGLRIPLRHLSLRAGPLPNSLALCRGQNVLITMQTASESAFDLWVKTIAIELIRQTPLDAVKYLDILTLTECWKHKDKETKCHEKDCNFNCIKSKDDVGNSTCTNCSNENPKNSLQTKNLVINQGNSQSVKYQDEMESQMLLTINSSDEVAVEMLLKRCQNSESYVPVKEKLMLFESLCRLGRKVRSTEDVSFKVDVGAKRARSLHDLTNCSSTNVAVREICKYFENKSDPNDCKKFSTMDRKNRRLINSDSQLNSVKIFSQYVHNASYA